MARQFITFGSRPHFNGATPYDEIAKVLCLQAKGTGLFDKVTPYTDQDLKNDKEFWDSHSKFIERRGPPIPERYKQGRGYGYWIWKPYLINKTMRSMKDGDMLLYLDAGCEIELENKTSMSNLRKYADVIGQEKIIGGLVGHDERRWTKMDLPLYLRIVNESYMAKPQRCAGTNMFSICEETRALVSKWYSLACDYHLIDDSPSVSRNYDQFIEHRHDQSIFSQLTKKYDLFSKNCKLSDCTIISRIRRPSKKTIFNPTEESSS